MEIKTSYTLEVLKNKHNKYVLCIIRVSEQGLKYYLGQNKPHFTRRWLKDRHWMAFDSKLQELEAENALKVLSHALRFQLTGSVFLEITKSKIPIDLLCRTIIELEISPADVVAAIDCKFEYVEKKFHQQHVTPRKKELHNDQDSPRKENHHKENKSSQKKHLDHSPESLRKEKTHKGSKTPQKKQLLHGQESQDKEKYFKEYSTPRKEELHYYHKSSCKEKPYKENKTPQKEIFSKMASFEKQRLENRNQKNSTKIENQVEKDKISFLSSDENQEIDPFDLPITMLRQQGTDLKSSSDSEEEYNINRKKKKRTKLIESHKDKNFEKALAVLNGNMDKLTKSTNFNKPISVPIHFQKSTEDIQTPTKLTEQKQKTKNSILTAPKEISASSKIISKKRKSRLSSLEPKATRKMTDCFTKIIPLVTKERARTELSSASDNINSLEFSGENNFLSSQNSSQEVIEKQIQSAKARTNYNREVTNLFKKLTPKEPSKVKVLDLMNLTCSEILKTFEQYQQQLEDLFIECKSKPKQKFNNGVDHFLVMSLLSNTTQLEMMNKLSDRYEKTKHGLPKYGELFSMVLMPEWILGIFMKQYGMTRENAIEHIKAQNAYKIYTQSEVQIDETIRL